MPVYHLIGWLTASRSTHAALFRLLVVKPALSNHDMEHSTDVGACAGPA